MPYWVAQVRIGVRKQQAYMSFLSEPHTRFTVKTTMGQSSCKSIFELTTAVMVQALPWKRGSICVECRDLP